MGSSVHPHGRGDNRTPCQGLRALRGSPPRAWGQRRTRRPPGSGRPVHPHGRGDNLSTHRTKHEHASSPPRAWGQFSRRLPRQCWIRFTPTGVGTISRSRMRRAAVVGSPPRAWGQLRLVEDVLAVCRFTPTGVGTMVVTYIVARLIAVHPHGRGDNWRVVFLYVFPIGSPPRAWGQLHGDDPKQPAVRFTPTGVGTMQPVFSTRSSASVHPHGRGDNVRKVSERIARRGSPPRAWGQ